jgi:hypothetical protein
MLLRNLWNSLYKVLKEVPLRVFILTLYYCLSKNKGITIGINSYSKEQLLDKPALKECAINTNKVAYI